MSARPKKKKAFHFDSWFVSQLRSISRRYPPIYTTRNKNKETYYITTKMGKQAKRVQWECPNCKKKFGNKEIVVDHVSPIVGPEGFPMLENGKRNWNLYIEKLFCLEDNLAISCKECHLIKTNKEKQGRIKK